MPVPVAVLPRVAALSCALLVVGECGCAAFVLIVEVLWALAKRTEVQSCADCSSTSAVLV